MSDKEIFDLAIVGAGAAGMTAAIYALRARKSVVVFEQNAVGGQILPAQKVTNYPAILEISGRELAEQMRTQVKSLGGSFVLEKVEKIEQSLLHPENMSEVTSALQIFKLEADGEEYLARTVILANGSAERRLDLPGEKALIGHGISYCASCDGEFFAGKTVAVYGGGSAALSSALYLAGLAKKIYLITRSTRLRAETRLIERAKMTPNIEFWPNWKIAELKSVTSESLKLTGVVLENSSTHEKQILELDGLFVSIGRVADNLAFRGLVDLDEDGYIASGESCLTKTPGVFCAGDTRQKELRQVVTACADGAVAASAAINYLNNV